jgi:hypothetical protein
VADLHREKPELLEENASLKKGLAFMLGRYFSVEIRLIATHAVGHPSAGISAARLHPSEQAISSENLSLLG